MKTCANCGSRVDDRNVFCGTCGYRMHNSGENHNSMVQPNRGNNGKILCCPECQGQNLSAIVESTTDGGAAVSTPLTKKFGVTSYATTTTHRNYWVCQSCGCKFRNLQDLKKEIESEQGREKTLKRGSLISGVLLGLLLLLLGLLGWEFLLLLIFAWGPLLVLVTVIIAMWVGTRNKVAKLLEEKRYLQKNSFVYH